MGALIVVIMIYIYLSRPKVNIFKCLEENIDVIVSEIPEFDESRVTIGRKEGVWNGESGLEFIKEMKSN